MKTNSRDNFFVAISAVIVIISIIGAINVYSKIKPSNFEITGNAVDSASVNVTVGEVIVINFTSNNVNWGSGAVTEGKSSAKINTWGEVVNGSWDIVNTGLIIKNEGNVNVSLNISTGKNAESFIGGTNPVYSFKVSNVEEDACTPPAEFIMDETYDAGTDTKVCDLFAVNSSIRVDIELIIPSDSDLGILTDTLSISIQEA